MSQPNTAHTEKKPNVMRNWNFQLLFWGAFVSNIGATLYSFAVSFYMLRISDNNAVLQGAYLAVCGITFLLLSPLGGVLGDRWNKAKVLVACDYIKGALILLSAVIVHFAIQGGQTTVQIVLLFVLAVANNAIAAFFSPASTALLPLLVKDDQLQQANSYFSVLGSFQSILGVVLAGILYAAMPITTLFFVVGACYVLSGFSEMFIRCRHEKAQSAMSVRGMLRDFGQGIAYMRGEKALSAIVLSALFVNFFITPYISNGIPYFITSRVATAAHYLLDSVLTPEMWSSVFTVSLALGGLVMGMIYARMKPPEKYGPTVKRWLLVMAGGFVLIAAAYFLLAERGGLNAFLIIITALLCLISASSLMVNVPLSTVLQQKVKPDMLAKVSSLINIGSQGLTPIASLLAGLVISAMGLGALWAICATGFIVMAVLMYMNRAVDTL